MVQHTMAGKHQISNSMKKLAILLLLITLSWRANSQFMVDNFPSANMTETRGFWLGHNTYVGQSFACNANCKITSARFYVYKSGSPTGNIYAILYSHTVTWGSTGLPLTLLETSSAVDISTFPSTSNWVTWTFSQTISLSSGTKYFIALYYNAGSGGTNPNYADQHYGTQAPGNYAYSNDGTSWTADANFDIVFEVYGITSNNAQTFIFCNPF